MQQGISHFKSAPPGCSQHRGVRRCKVTTSGMTIENWEKITFMQIPYSAQSCKVFTEKYSRKLPNWPVSTEYVNKLKLSRNMLESYRLRKTHRTSFYSIILMPFKIKCHSGYLNLPGPLTKEVWMNWLAFWMCSCTLCNWTKMGSITYMMIKKKKVKPVRAVYMNESIWVSWPGFTTLLQSLVECMSDAVWLWWTCVVLGMVI